MDCICIGINYEFYSLKTLLEGTTIEMRLSQVYDRSASIFILSIRFQLDMVETSLYILSLSYLEYFI